MKINIEFDTEHDSKCLIASVLKLISESKCKCTCHSEPVKKDTDVKPEEPKQVDTVKVDTVKPNKNSKKKRTYSICENENCGKRFLQKRKDRVQKYCCRTCANAATASKRAEILSAKANRTHEDSDKQLELFDNEQLKPTAPTKPQYPEKREPDPVHRCKLCDAKFVDLGNGTTFCSKCIKAHGGEDGCQVALEEKLGKFMVHKTPWKTCPKCGRDFHDPKDEHVFCSKCETDLEPQMRKFLKERNKK